MSGGAALVAKILAVAMLAVTVPSVAAAKVGVGQKAPAIELRDLDGRLVQLKDLAYPGRERPGKPKHFVLVDFFRTDCPPCKRGLPHLAKFYESYRKLGVTVLLVAVKEDDQILRDFLRSNPMPFPVLTDTYAKAGQLYGVVEGTSTQLPATFLIDPDGVVKMIIDGVDDSLAGLVAPALQRR